MIDFSDFPEISSPIGYFMEISKIPRGSGNTKMIADHLYAFAAERGLEAYRDEYDNVVIKKPATPGYEERPILVLQGHTDIVAEKAAGCDIDMEKEGVRIFRDGDLLGAEGTTLGADDGIALAYCMALLDAKDLPHPALECVFTSDEETGLTGAANISPDLIKGRIMINLDSGDEGVFTVGCAGGLRADITLPTQRAALVGECYRLSLVGLLGGHSGVEIDKNRINALKVMGELISSVDGAVIVNLHGGNADNAIPRDAYAVIAVEKPMDTEALASLAKELTEKENGSFTVEKIQPSETALDAASTGNILALLKNLPTGVYKMSDDIPGLVETSLNIAVADTNTEAFTLTVSIRSSKGEEKAALCKKVTKTAEELGAKVTTRGEYPGWEYRKDSRLREVMRSRWEKLFGEKPKVVMIHAGLECGIFSDKLAGLDCVSTGPNHFDIHTPLERLSLSSFSKVWKFLLEVIKNI